MLVFHESLVFIIYGVDDIFSKLPYNCFIAIFKHNFLPFFEKIIEYFFDRFQRNHVVASFFGRVFSCAGWLIRVHIRTLITFIFLDNGLLILRAEHELENGFFEEFLRFREVSALNYKWSFQIVLIKFGILILLRTEITTWVKAFFQWVWNIVRGHFGGF